MSLRKRFRETPAAKDTSPIESVPSQTVAAGPSSNASASSVMSKSPANSTSISVAESTSSSAKDKKDSEGRKDSDAARYASFRESKNQTRSWYGSWPRAPKSEASTQLAKETILGASLKTNSTADFTRFDTRKADDASDGASASDTSTLPRKTPTRPAISQLTVGLEQQQQQQQQQNIDPPQTKQGPAIVKADKPPPQQARPNAAAKPTTQAAEAPKATESTQPTQPAETSGTTITSAPEQTDNNESSSATATGWLSWLSRSAPADTKQPSAQEAVMAPQPPDGPKAEDAQAPPAVTEGDGPNKTTDEAPKDQSAASASRWTYFWSKTADDAAAAESSGDKGSESQDVVMHDAPASAPSEPIPVPAAPSTGGDTIPATASAGSTWAFWSRDSRPKSLEKAGSPEQGEIAVIGERSEAHPKPAAGIEVKDAPSRASSVKEPGVKEPAGKKSSKRLRPESTDTEDSTPGTPIKSKSETKLNTRVAEAAKADAKVDVNGKGDASSSSKQQQQQEQQKASSKQAASARTAAPNLLLPSFSSTYSYKENPSILRQIARLLWRTQQPPANHAFRVKDTPKFKKAVAIGVHGLFPAAFLRPMIGQPTGTSIRFANHCAEAVRRWADSHGCEDCEIEKIALEGEGKIADRVENLWRLLLNWIDHIRNADLVVLACHSQGVPVGFMLLAKLIDLGIVTTARIGVCAMAGVSLGPFPEYKSGLGILMGSAAELWEFSNPESEVSKRYEAALKTALDYGVRVTYVGSIDDQVVPLESAVYSPVTHPYIYRAVFVDGRIHAPDFIAHLVGFACKLRNLGISDHGLIRELSIPLAGSLYKGEGHSRIYDEPQVYDLALSHSLETADMGHVPCDIKKHEGLANPNPYHLPWIMRGLLEEDFVKTDLHEETAELVKQFDGWKPTTKALKDVKYRLEAVRSKL